jgi:hypothetical protein
LTLLDVWSQTLVPSILLQQSEAAAQRAGDFSTASRLTREIRAGLDRVEGFDAEVVHDPVFRDRNPAEVVALRAAAAAWTQWASLLLGRVWVPAGERTRRLAALERSAIRLHQAAYFVIDASIRTALRVR